MRSHSRSWHFKPLRLDAKGRAGLVLLLVLLRSAAAAQCDGKPGADGLTWEYDDAEKESFSIVRFIGNALTPDLIKETRKIRAYVRDPRFLELMKRCGDARAVDAIYLRSLKIAEHNISRALFLALMGTLEHRNVDFKVPVVGPIGVPLTFEADSLFNTRFKNLPSRLYRDTPPEGDRDKLQHFFASAYISYASESRELARNGGNFVEWGEAQFVVGGVDDPRDRRANRHGEQFGHDLLTVKTLLPSDYFNLPFEE
ncbi:MAG TPA: hypothetical protein VMH23_08410 [Bacteroidota bacterium]|nr:hypothetical protein [Bacteroidota bacterium]